MSDTRVSQVWNSYWFRLVVTGLPVGILVGVVTWFQEFAGIKSVPYFVLLLVVLLTYGFLFEEPYIKPWRREPIKS